MERNQRMARLFRAISGKSQEQFARDTGIHPITVSNIERGQDKASPRLLALMAADVGLGVEQGDEILQFCDILRRERVRAGSDPRNLLDQLDEPLRTRGERFFQRLLTLPLPTKPPSPEDRIHAEEQMAILRRVDTATRRILVGISEEFQTWAVVELAAQAALEAATRDLSEARDWTDVAILCAQRIRGTTSWRNRVLGYARAHEAHIVNSTGHHEVAGDMFADARQLWNSGEDPDGLLDGSAVFG